MSKTLNLYTVCRCCHNNGQFKDTQGFYIKENNVRLYTKMLDFLGIKISRPDAKVSYAICNNCTQLLQRLHAFKQTVLACEEKFKEYYMKHIINNEITSVTIKQEIPESQDSVPDTEELVVEVIKKEELKEEPEDYATSDTEELVYNEEIKIEEFNKYVEEAGTSDQTAEISKPGTSKTYNCDTCQITFSSESALTIHKQIHLKDLCCVPCNIQFYNSSTLQQHIDEIHGVDGKFICYKCEREFKSASEMKDHVETYHNMLYDCSVCKEPFQVSQLHGHMHIRRETEQMIPCDICNMTFSGVTQLNDHLRSHVGEEKPYKCTLCHSKYRFNSTLKRHMSKAHRNINQSHNKHSSEQPGYSYYDKNILLLHKRARSKDKPFTCKVCNKQFRSGNKLKTHFLGHSDLKPYACTLCDRRFKLKNHLDVHLRIHTGEKPFECEICHKGFATNCLKIHMRTHTGENGELLTS